jgi:polyisoprenoid-binding protein YceI
MRITLAIVTAALPVLAGAQQLPERYEIDRSHSVVGFNVRFMGMSTVRGGFTLYAASIMYHPEAVEKTTVSAIIATNSINTNSPDRDRHLKSPDFFEVEKYPYITFRSTAIRKTKSGFDAEGDFAMHGVTKRITIPFRMLNPPMPDAWGNSRMTLEGSTKVSRKEYGIAGTAFWNGEFDPGRFAVADEVTIELLVSATVPNVMRWTDRAGDSLLTEIETRGVEAAVADMRAARATNPKIDSIPPFAFSVAAGKLMAKKRVADAVALYEAVTSMRPNANQMKAQLGEAYLKAGQLDKALATFRIVAAADSTHTGAKEWVRVLERRTP